MYRNSKQIMSKHEKITEIIGHIMPLVYGTQNTLI